jgi:hypothetical protein
VRREFQKLSEFFQFSSTVCQEKRSFSFVVRQGVGAPAWRDGRFVFLGISWADVVRGAGMSLDGGHEADLLSFWGISWGVAVIWFLVANFCQMTVSGPGQYQDPLSKLHVFDGSRLSCSLGSIFQRNCGYVTSLF